MKRKIYDKLLEWKDKKEFKPLIIFGARQVGKTYVINEFCEKEFKNYKRINLFEDTEIVELFQSKQNVKEKYLKLISYAGVVENEDNILFIDEIQESKELLSSLKYIHENHSNLRIICAGSLLGVAIKKKNVTFPVGKVEMLNMYPMDFEEYLYNFNELELIKEIKSSYISNKALLETSHNKALNYYNLYLYTGGMPEVVDNIIKCERNVTLFDNSIVKNIVLSYFQDMSKYVENNSITMKLNQVYSKIPSQLGNASKKFQYSKIENNARKRDYESPIDWLLNSRIVIKSDNVSSPIVPLNFYIVDDTFKLYMSDVGLLINLSNITYQDIIKDNLSISKGVITENYVATELISNYGENLFYWKNQNATAEVDFLIQTSDGIIPIEVKSSNNTQSKSLKIYVEKYKPKYSIRLSTKNFGYENNIKSVPLYAVFCIKKY